MLLERYSNGVPIVSQGDDATAMFIVKSGRVEVVKDDRFVTQLGSGAYFGENALSSGTAKRSATVRAVGEVQCFSISRGVLHMLFGQDVALVASMNEQRRLFASSPVLNQFSEEQTERLLRELHTTHASAGDLIVAANQPVQDIVLVMDGTASVERAVFGEEALLQREVRSVGEVRAKTACKLCVLPVKSVRQIFGEDLEALFARNAQFKLAMHQCTPARTADKLPLDRLKVVKVIGEGNYGMVYLVNENGELFALKLVPKSKMETLSDVKGLLNEKSTLELISFPKIVSMKGYAKTSNAVCFLNEFVDGVGFEKVLVELDIFTREHAVFYASQILLILQYLHLHGIVYRDLKPGNLICRKNGYVKLVDMGTCKFLQKNKFGVYERTFTVVGTAHYMAPEIISGAGYTFSADYWAFGVMLFEMMCGYLPFGNDSADPLAIYKEITNAAVLFPEWFDDAPSREFISQLLAKSPETRTGSSLWALNTHEWFRGVDWHRVLFEQQESPFCPQASSIRSMASFGGFEDRPREVADLIAQRWSANEHSGSAEYKMISEIWENF